MNTESLEYFIKVYEKKSVTSAAKDLYITPQGLSKTIKQLEKEMETGLFYRGSRGVEPTEAGELLYARAKHICYLIEDIKKEISVMTGNKGILNLLITYSTEYVIPMISLFNFQKEYPNIHINFKEVPDEYAFENAIDEEKIDAGLAIVNDKNDSCEYELIKKGEVVLVVSKNNPLYYEDEVSIKDLSDESFIIKSVEEGEEHNFVSKCLELGFTPQVKYEISNVFTAHALCNNDMGIYVSIDFIEKSLEDKELKVIRLKEKIYQNIYLVTKKRAIQSKLLSLFKKYVDLTIKDC